MSWDEYYSYQKGGSRWGGNTSYAGSAEHTGGVKTWGNESGIHSEHFTDGTSIEYSGPHNYVWFKIGKFAVTEQNTRNFFLGVAKAAAIGLLVIAGAAYLGFGPAIDLVTASPWASALVNWYARSFVFEEGTTIYRASTSVEGAMNRYWSGVSNATRSWWYKYHYGLPGENTMSDWAVGIVKDAAKARVGIAPPPEGMLFGGGGLEFYVPEVFEVIQAVEILATFSL
jgi:hypothetical protein